ncbi:hypothetical protein [Ideonella sp.]|uniref:hypothetical protein n=1 Tax=Ideonella sp. TaxID=1929293 RepID=UPI002B490578|nr:hypothetical protein [Ideonella sp.]HJV71215.1 hypothetical protein [Ideonella sp.]
MHKLLPASLALALVAPWSAHAQSTPSSTELKALRDEIAALRGAYEARLQSLEARLKAAEAQTASAAATPAATPPAAVAPASLPAPAGGGANAFNPAISLILSGGYTRTSQDPENYTITGFQLPVGGEIGPGGRGFSLAESELGLSASIDPWLRGVANIALAPENEVSVEEAYIQTTSLGGGLTLKAGRFFSGIGYLNPQHAHTWDFADNPLAYQAMLGTQYGDDGVQLNWLAPTDQFIELGVELGRGRGFPGGDNSRNGIGMAALTAHTGGDIGDSHSWRAGLSVLNARADGLGLVGTAADGGLLESAFSGSTRVWVADGVWKWSPNGNATRTSFKLQGEYLQSRRSGDLTPDGGDAAAYRSTQSGWYLQGVYQFLPGWRIGLRTEQLDARTPDYGANNGLYALTGYSPRKNSLMLDFNPSEFSRVRLQLAQDRSREGATDNQLMLQYQMSLGAHGAHSF